MPAPKPTIYLVAGCNGVGNRVDSMDMLPLGEIRGQTKLIKNMVAKRLREGSKSQHLRQESGAKIFRDPAAS